MKTKLMALSLVSILSLSYSNYALAHEGMKHDEGMEAMDHEKGSMMDHQEGTEANSKAVEVGNKICPVSGDKIPAPGEKEAMGEAVKYEYNGKIYNLCCKMCIKDFKKDPEKYSKIAEEEVAQEKVMDTEHKENQVDEGSHDHSSYKH